MKYSARQFKENFPEWKKKQCGIVTKNIHRPISFFCASLFSNLGISANWVSFISWFWAILTCCCFIVHNENMYIVGAIAVNIWLVLDCTDGNIARVVGGHPYGDFIDAASGYFIDGFFIPVVSFAAYYQGGLFIGKTNPWIMLIGAITSMCCIMQKLYYHKAMDIEHLSDGKLNIITGNGKKGEGKISKIYNEIHTKLIDKEWDMVLIIVCAVAGKLDIYVLLYFVIYCSEFLVYFAFMVYKLKILYK